MGLAAAGIPAILVPSPNVTADHQTTNARFFEHGGGAVVMPETDLGAAPTLIRSLLDDPARLQELRRGMLALARPDAAETIAEEQSRLSADGTKPSRVVASGSSGSAEPGSRRTRSSRARGVRRSGAGIASRPRTSRTSPVSSSICRPSRARPTAGRSSSRRRTRAASTAARAPTSSPRLTSLRDAIVVGGTHGKGTTAAMIAFVLDRLGHDHFVLIGAEVQLRRQRAGRYGWLVVEGDESDGTVFGLRARIAVLTNVELDHHSSFASRAEARGPLRGVARARRSRRPRRGASAVDGALAASRRAQPPQRGLRARGARARRRRPIGRWALRDFREPGAASSVAGRSGASRSSTYGHHRPRSRRRSRRRASLPRAVSSSSSSRISSRGHGISPWSSRPRSRPPTSSASRTCTRRARRRSTASPASSSSTRSRSAGPACRSRGRRPSRMGSRRAHGARGRHRPDGRRRRRRPRRAVAPGSARVTFDEQVPLARFTTLGTGGPARAGSRAFDRGRARGGARVRRPEPRGGGRGPRLQPARRRRGSTRSSSS